MAGTPKNSITGIAQWWPVRIATPSLSRIVPRSCGCTPSSVKETTRGLVARGADEREARDRAQALGGRAASSVLVRGDRLASPRPST